MKQVTEKEIIEYNGYKKIHFACCEMDPIGKFLANDLLEIALFEYVEDGADDAIKMLEKISRTT